MKITESLLCSFPSIIIIILNFIGENIIPILFHPSKMLALTIGEKIAKQTKKLSYNYSY